MHLLLPLLPVTALFAVVGAQVITTSDANAVESILCAALTGTSIPCSSAPTTLQTSATTQITTNDPGSTAATTEPSTADPQATTCPTLDPSATGSTPYCVPFSDPRNGVSNVCNCQDGGYYTMQSGCNPCPWTTVPPASDTYVRPTPTAASTAYQVTVPANPSCAPTHAADAACWSSVGAVVALQEFWQENQATCASNGFEDFANCWYSVKLNETGNDCGVLTTGTGCRAPNWNDFEDASQTPELDFYVTYAIYNSNKFFTDLYAAVNFASGSAASQVGLIVDTLTPQDTSTNPWEYILLGLSFALSLYSEGSIVQKALLRTAPQTSTILEKLLFPSDDKVLADEIHKWADAESKVGQLTDEWSASIEDALTTMFGDLGTFLSWCNNEFDCTAPGTNIDIHAMEDPIKLSIGTYIVSRIMNEEGLVVTRAAGLDVNQLQATAGSSLRWDTNCGNGYDAQGTCASYFFDGTDTYSITRASDINYDFSDFLQQIFGGASPMTTGKLLFTGGYQCTQTCDSTLQGCEPDFQPTPDGFAPLCLSSLRVCTWNWHDVTPFFDSPQCPDDAFSWQWGQARCKSHAFDDNAFTVPFSYLGGGIMK